jgi:release factor glutamine methyltransferase
MERLPAEVRHEPREALSGGNSGLEFYAKIIKKAPYFLKKDGIIAFEVGDGLYRKVEMLLRLSRQFSDIRPHKDLNRIDRVITAKRV